MSWLDDNWEKISTLFTTSSLMKLIITGIVAVIVAVVPLFYKHYVDIQSRISIIEKDNTKQINDLEKKLRKEIHELEIKFMEGIHKFDKDFAVFKNKHDSEIDEIKRRTNDISHRTNKIR